MQLKRLPWGSFKGRNAELFSIIDPKTGFQVDISDFGATLVRVKTPDKVGNITDINFGQDNPELYLQYGGYLGAVVGRVANRISNAEFELEGQKYKLFVNNANLHSLHGGKSGFNVKWWSFDSSEFKDDEAILKFHYDSLDGEENYPGNLLVNLTYIISPMKLAWIFEAVTDKTTIINLTNHAYWNLDGLESLIDDTFIKMNVDRYMPGDENNLPLGDDVPTTGTSIDLKDFRQFKDIFTTFGDIDNNFFIAGYESKKNPKELLLAAEVHSPNSGRTMKVYTSEPCCQCYSGNYMSKIISFGIQCQKHSAFCLETQRAPNAINLPKFRDSVILQPGQTYYHKTVHEFGIK
jgi:aldose 1-epimerase